MALRRRAAAAARRRHAVDRRRRGRRRLLDLLEPVGLRPRRRRRARTQRMAPRRQRAPTQRRPSRSVRQNVFFFSSTNRVRWTFRAILSDDSQSLASDEMATCSNHSSRPIMRLIQLRFLSHPNHVRWISRFFLIDDSQFLAVMRWPSAPTTNVDHVEWKLQKPSELDPLASVSCFAT